MSNILFNYLNEFTYYYYYLQLERKFINSFVLYELLVGVYSLLLLVLYISYSYHYILSNNIPQSKKEQLIDTNESKSVLPMAIIFDIN